MILKKQVAIIGGDARYLELIKKLISKPNYTIKLIGYDQLDQGFLGVQYTDLEELNPEILDVIILPITGVEEGGYVKSTFSNRSIRLPDDFFGKLKSSTLVFTGINTNYLKQVTKDHPLTLIPMMERDDVAIYNSVPTAEGTILLALQQMKITLQDSNVIVLGLGRVGLTVADKFAKLGANVYAGVRKTKDIAKAKTFGFEGFHLSELPAYIKKCNLLINTVPALIVDEPELNAFSADALIIDLASKPGGINFEYAKKRGLNTIHALGLPAKVAPKTAGEILATVIDQLIAEHQ
ncbi:dipicolinate synthase subunit DpsA [Amphibacillus xylanus]|uniref:Dipicolinate synthase A chain n=1 Tax=Amphibacillus xylanus (strain ATCC 51415 / DSM 6626 / JCM 7361 / LMG 17667 / NBRC 15112 / Ep01) TaxID=698758 RepID=K0J4F5_AMPXN|nr:dipicolinate synthase subunit DpsA [Amphibacillus xylanus]BAM47581.1 dipicolinate synthase A chain [Amphibacillus xylanus NBRC 15112]